jgi:hypothetical protein
VINLISLISTAASFTCLYKYCTQHDVERKAQGVILLSETCRVSRAEGSNTFEISVGDR